MKLNRLFPILAVLLFVACQAELPKGVLSERRLERVLYDYHKAQGMADAGVIDGKSGDLQRYELQEAVFRKHKITREQFDSTMNYYCSNLERLNRIYKHLDRRLKREAEALGEVEQSGSAYTSLSAEGDTANVWGGSAIIVVTNVPGNNVITWRQPCDSTWRSDDDIMWRFESKYLSRAGTPELFADIVVTYTNDSVRAFQRRARSDGFSELRMATPSGWTPRSIAGHLYMPPTQAAEERSLYVLHDHLLVRFRKNVETAPVDSLAADSLRNRAVTPDSLAADSAARLVPDDDRRLSPTEFRESQSVDQKIDIVKEKPYQPSARPSRGHLQPARRRVQR